MNIVAKNENIPLLDDQNATQNNNSSPCPMFNDNK